MKYFRFLAIIALVYSNVLFASEKPAPANKAVDELTEILKGINSLKGEFEQILRDKKGEVVQKSQGNFTLKRPGYFLWESQAPYEQVVIGNPQTLWVYDPDLEQVTVRTQDLSARGNPARLLSGDFEKMAEQYAISKSGSDKDKVFNLQPNNASVSNFTDIAFSFKNATLDHLSFTDSLGQKTTLTLQNTVANDPVDLKIFDFVAPEGTDIIVDDEQ